MEKEKKHIDNLFSEQLSNYEAAPPSGSWSRIENTLWERRYHAFRRKVMRIAAVAILFVGLAGGYLYYTLSQNDTDISPAIAQQSDEVSPSAEINSTNPANTVSSGKNSSQEPSSYAIEKKAEITETTAFSSDNNAIAVVTFPPDNADVETGFSINTSSAAQEGGNEVVTFESRKSIAAVPVSPTEKTNSKTATKAIHSLIAIKKLNETDNLNQFAKDFAALTKDKSIAQKQEAEWMIGGQIAPLYSYRNISKEGAMPVNTAWYNEIETPLYTYAGGVNVNYSSGNRFRIRTGIYYLKLGQGIDDVRAYTAMGTGVSGDYKNSYTEIAVSNSVGKITSKSSGISEFSNLETTPGSTLRVTNEVSSSLATTTDISNLKIEQTYEYLEVPLLVEYKIIDKTIDMLFITGVSANFLVGNQVSAVDGAERFDIGKTEDLNSINYSGTLGIGFAYDIAQQVSLSLEPNFRYYFNPINATGIFDHHPYAFGFSTGVNFTF